ncbi:MAG TPA: hypothetical protein VN634_14795 [Candidatus Limnocylindrales bacterium]|nr:hypothetical protein [Candidatus Limnocylindrales bacterium]
MIAISGARLRASGESNLDSVTSAAGAGSGNPEAGTSAGSQP